MCNTIKSVLGFDLDAEIQDTEGNILPSGTTCNYEPTQKPNYKITYFNYHQWTNFNKALLNKVIDCKKNRGL